MSRAERDASIDSVAIPKIEAVPCCQGFRHIQDSIRSRESMILTKSDIKTAADPDLTSSPAEERIELPKAYSGPSSLANLLLDCISETLTDLLGTRVREAVYDYMERNCHVARNEIPEHLDDLFKLLERCFGARSMDVIGRAIARNLYSKLDLRFESVPKFRLIDYLERIRSRISTEVLSGRYR
jgi:hypothetical protein